MLDQMRIKYSQLQRIEIKMLTRAQVKLHLQATTNQILTRKAKLELDL